MCINLKCKMFNTMLQMCICFQGITKEILLLHLFCIFLDLLLL